jgi:hypothetical protein
VVLKYLVVGDSNSYFAFPSSHPALGKDTETGLATTLRTWSRYVLRDVLQACSSSASATARIRVAFADHNGKLVTRSENFSLQAGAGSRTRGDQSQKCDEKRVVHGDDYCLTNGRKLCVFRLDGVFGMDRTEHHKLPLALGLKFFGLVNEFRAALCSQTLCVRSR